MAEVTIDTRINTAGAATGLKDLRKSLKDLVSAQAEVGAGTAEFKKLQTAINQTENKLGDLNDAFGTLRGSGVERLSGSLNLLKEGLLTVDPGKVSIAMEGLGAAMKAIPIFLLIEGIRLLIENFDDVVKFVKSFTSANEGLKQSLEDVNTQIAIQTDLNKKYLDAVDQSTAIIIERSKQRGASERELFEIQVRANEEKIRRLTADEQEYRDNLEKLEAGFYKRTIEMSDEDFKKEKDKLKALNDAAVKAGEERIKIIDTNDLFIEQNRTKRYEKAVEDEKKASENRIKSFQDQLAFNLKAQEDYDASILKEKQKAHDDELKLFEDQIKAEQKLNDDSEAVQRKAEDEHQKYFTKAAKDALAEREKEAAQQDATYKKYEAMLKARSVADTQTLQAIYAGYYQNKLTRLNNASNAELNKVRGNTQAEFEINKKKFVEEQKIRKQAFEANKNFQLALAINNAAQGVLAALGSAPPPYNILLAAVTAGLSAAQVAIIADSEFEEGVAPAPPSLDVGGGGGGGGGGGPENVNTPDPKRQFNPNAIETNQQGQRVWVHESDITRTQKKVQVIEERATFP